MEGGKALATIVLSLTCLAFAGCTSAPPESCGGDSLETVAGVPYSIIDSYILPDIKRSLNVRLSEKVSDDTLRTIALKLKAQDSRSYQRTFISYFLPDMPLNSGAWATTHFNPNLEVRILGSSLAQEEQFRNQVTTPQSSVIGCWLYEIRGAPDMNRTYTICRQDERLYIKTAWTDGTSGTEPVEEKPHPEGRFLQTKKQATVGEYFLLDGEGNLQLWDKEGWFATAKQLN